MLCFGRHSVHQSWAKGNPRILFRCAIPVFCQSYCNVKVALSRASVDSGQAWIVCTFLPGSRDFHGRVILDRVAHMPNTISWRIFCNVFFCNLKRMRNLTRWTMLLCGIKNFIADSHVNSKGLMLTIEGVCHYTTITVRQ